MADVPLAALLLRVEELAKGWLLALLEQAPLRDSASILTPDLVRDGPRICDAVVRALANDGDLRRIEPGGPLEPLVSRAGELAGARGAEASARAVDALQAVVWSAIRDELTRPDPDQISELAERLSMVSDSVRGATLRSWERLAGTRRPSEAPDDLWGRALEDEIARAERLGSCLALMLVELEDADRVLAVESPSEAGAALGHFAQAVRSVVGSQDILACQTDTRAWIIARDTGRSGAMALGSRIAAAVRATAPWRGAAMTVNVGHAVLGQDGRDRASLIDAAEQSKFAAEASGVAVGQPQQSDEPPIGSEPPAS